MLVRWPAMAGRCPSASPSPHQLGLGPFYGLASVLRSSLPKSPVAVRSMLRSARLAPRTVLR